MKAIMARISAAQVYDILYRKAGVDGLFTDFPDQAVQYLQQMP